MVREEGFGSLARGVTPNVFRAILMNASQLASWVFIIYFSTLIFCWDICWWFRLGMISLNPSYWRHLTLTTILYVTLRLVLLQCVVLSLRYCLKQYPESNYECWPLGDSSHYCLLSCGCTQGRCLSAPSSTTIFFVHESLFAESNYECFRSWVQCTSLNSSINYIWTLTNVISSLLSVSYAHHWRTRVQCSCLKDGFQHGHASNRRRFLYFWHSNNWRI